MKSILKNNEIDAKNSDITKEFLIKTSIYLSSNKWFKGSRSRGIR